jgi:hypothetical protein
LSNIPPFLLNTSKIEEHTATITIDGESREILYPKYATFDNQDTMVTISPKELSGGKEDYDFKIEIENTIEETFTPIRTKPISVIPPTIIRVFSDIYDNIKVGSPIKISKHYDEIPSDEFYHIYRQHKDIKFIVKAKKIENGLYYITLDRPFPQERNTNGELVSIEIHDISSVIVLDYFHMRGNPVIETEEQYTIQDTPSIENYGEKTYEISGRATDFNYITDLAQYVLHRHKGGYLEFDEEESDYLFMESLNHNVPICTFKLHKNQYLCIGDVVRIKEDVFFMKEEFLQGLENTYTITKKKINLTEFDEFEAIYTPLTKQIPKLDIEKSEVVEHRPISSTDPMAHLTEDQARKQFTVDGSDFINDTPKGLKFVELQSEAWVLQCETEYPNISTDKYYAVSYSGKSIKGKLTTKSTPTELYFIPMDTSVNTSFPEVNELVYLYYSTENNAPLFTLQNLKSSRLVSPPALVTTFTKPQNTLYTTFSLYTSPTFSTTPDIPSWTLISTNTTDLTQIVIGNFGTLSYDIPILDEHYVLTLTATLDTLQNTSTKYISFSKEGKTMIF